SARKTAVGSATSSRTTRPRALPTTCGRNITARNPATQRSWVTHSSKLPRCRIPRRCSSQVVMPLTLLCRRPRSGCDKHALTRHCPSPRPVRFKKGRKSKVAAVHLHSINAGRKLNFLELVPLKCQRCSEQVAPG